MILRKKGILLFLSIFILITLLMMIFTDKWLERTIERVGSNWVGAKVEIDHLNVSLLSLSVSWDRLQIAHPQHTLKNMIETGPVSLDLDFGALLKGKFVIEKMKIRDIRSFSERETDGALEKRQKRIEPVRRETGVMDKGVQIVKKQFSEIPALQLSGSLSGIRSKDIFQKVSLRTPEKIDSVKKALLRDIREIRTELQDTTFKKKIGMIEKDLQAIQPKKIKKLKDLKKELEKINRLLKEIQSLRREYGGKEQKVKDLLSKFNSVQEQMNQWIEEDFEKVRKAVGIPKPDKMEVSKFLFGQRLISYFETYLKYSGYFRKMQEKLSSDKPKKEKPPRMKGQDIYFVTVGAMPLFWLKKAEISGVTNADFSISGEMNDFTFQPTLTGKPIVFRAFGERKDHATYQMDWKYEIRDEKGRDSLSFSLEGIPIKNMSLQSGSDALPTAIESATGDFRFLVSTGEGNYEAIIRAVFRNPVFRFSQPKTPDRISKMVRDIFSDMKKVEISIRLWNEAGKTKLKVESNLDRIFRERLAAVLGKEAKRAEAVLRREFDRQITKQSKEFQQWLTRQIQEINSDFGVNMQQIELLENLQKEKKKEIEKEMKKQAGSFLNKFIK